MKADEFLTLYAAGERNFRGVNFEGQNLSGADFSEADIHSAKFTGANLKEAKFTGAKCGLQRRWVIALTVISWLLTALSGFFSILIGFVFAFIFDSQLGNQIGGWFGLTIIIVFSIIIIRRGLLAGAIFVAISATVVLAVMGTIAFFAAITVVVVGIVAVTLSGTVAITLSIAVTVSGTISRVIAGIIAIVIGILGATIAGWSGSGSIFERAVTIRGEIVQTDILLSLVAILGAIAVVMTLLISAICINWRLFKGDSRDAWIRNFAIAFAATKGTSFRNADLTDANFSYVKLKSTDFREANLTRVRWYGAKMLDRVRPGDTYLKSTQLRQWLIGKGKEKNFDRQDLRGINLLGGINLQGADLSDASFIKADLSGANLQNADLSRAKLVQTQLDNTDFTGATLTGTFIEDWGITSSTKLKGVKCEYVFMRLPPEKRPNWLALPVEQSLDPNPRRKPDNWDDKFESDDFADFIKPFFDTLDLYHNQEVDPRAIAISWKQLAENNPDANLRFASMEVKGEDNLLLRLKTTPNADLSKLNAEYFDNYNKYKGLSETELKILLIEQNVRVDEQIKVINQYENMLKTALGQNKSNYFIGGNMNKSDGNIYNTQNAGIVHNEGEIKDNAKVAGVINEAEQKNLADAAAEIQRLLEQLSKTYPTATTKQKMTVVSEAVDRVENNPSLKAKVINALKGGSIEAFKEMINHPLVNIFISAIEGWRDTE